LILLNKVIYWFIGLEAPNTEQAGFVSVLVGTGAAWFGLYQTILDKGKNPLALQIDKFRLFSSSFILSYTYWMFDITNWFLALSNPTMQQTGFVSAMVAAGTAWFGLYVKDKDAKSKQE
jgi:hypothetical protein